MAPTCHRSSGREQNDQELAPRRLPRSRETANRAISNVRPYVPEGKEGQRVTRASILGRKAQRDS